MNDETAHDDIGDDPEGTDAETAGAIPCSGDRFVDAVLRQAAHVSSSPRPQALPRIGQILGDKYRVEALIGRGGMGAVYRASHVLTGKQVALKWMLRSSADLTARRRLLREALAAGRIDHPNVVDVYDVGEHESCAAYLVMELLHGEALRARLARAPLDWREALEILLPAVCGVSAAHRAGVIHRDLKPDNIFLCTDPHGTSRAAKVLDFGIASVRSSDAGEPTLTGHGAILGTPAYMSPEQLTGARDVDVRTDVYAFGVILYEALTGRRPFQADSFPELVLAIAQQAPQRPSELRAELPQALERIVLRALAKAREDRFATMDELLDALVAVMPSVADDDDSATQCQQDAAASSHRTRAPRVRVYDAALSTTLSGAGAARNPPTTSQALSIWCWTGAMIAALACTAVFSALWSSPGSPTQRAELPVKAAGAGRSPSYAAQVPLAVRELPLATYAASNAGIATPRAGTLPRSCEEARRGGRATDASLHIDPDGPGGRGAIEVFCAGMAAKTDNDPAREYISLAHSAASGELGSNFTRFVYEGGTCACPDVTLRFTKVRVNPQTLGVDPSDLGFAAYDRSLNCEMQHKSQCGEALKLTWGGAGSCRAVGDTSGSASIDLRGTAFSLSSELRFVPAGFGAAGNALVSTDHKRAELVGGGRCGSLVAERGSIALVDDP